MEHTRYPPGPLLGLCILYRVRDPFYVAQDVRPEPVLAEDIENLQEPFTIEYLTGTTLVDPSRVEVRVLFSAGTACVHLPQR